ncbi:hypothetical protein EJ02DRAFT_458069 [Clathrospora elynae]|uniref:Uncharacterized protein n=1 Tax=Clathrospora elynae TaxID=706981 RepID=A0A6A5SLQ3_9PLEO|nr:hypothetical protein EJ02DRAFT_458069 [Clathrospora elynae]
MLDNGDARFSDRKHATKSAMDLLLVLLGFSSSMNTVELVLLRMAIAGQYVFLRPLCA